jgi:hypothetical protein
MEKIMVCWWAAEFPNLLGRSLLKPDKIELSLQILAESN